MSYKPKGKKLYSQMSKNLPQINRSFRNAWDTGLDRALQEAERLRSQGWTVEDPIASREADLLLKVAKKMGAKTQVIPIAEWNGDMMQYVAYKEKPGKTVAATAATKTPTQKKKKAPKKKKIDPTARFQKIFWKGLNVDADAIDNGVMVDPKRTIAVIPYNAKPAKTHGATIVQLFNEIKNPAVGKTTFVKSVAYSKLVSAPMNYFYFDDPGCSFTVDLAKKAMRTLNIKKAKVYHVKDKPSVIMDDPHVNPNAVGHAVILAPVAGKTIHNSMKVDKLA